MSEDTDEVDLRAIAADPETMSATLRLIATQYPQLRPVVALNPGAYDALVHWLGTLGEPEVDEALRERAIRYPKPHVERSARTVWWWGRVVLAGLATVAILLTINSVLG